MIRLRTIPFLLILVFLSGCSMLQSAKLLAPESFGLISIAPHLYAEVEADEATRAQLRADMARAEAAIRMAFGSVSARPSIHACITEKCYAAFGGRGSIAKVFGQRILLSPRGLNWHFLAHEWSHAEMNTRLTLLAWKRMPQWFDEGLAVAISEAAEHSEQHWEFLLKAHIAHPNREQLLSYHSLRQWLDAVHRFGEDKNGERMTKGEAPIRPVYAAAGHEVRQWLSQSGNRRLQTLIHRLNEGEDFKHVYEAVETPE